MNDHNSDKKCKLMFKSDTLTEKIAVILFFVLFSTAFCLIIGFFVFLGGLTIETGAKVATALLLYFLIFYGFIHTWLQPDKIYDCGHYLLIHKKNNVSKIFLNNIEKISYSYPTFTVIKLVEADEYLGKKIRLLAKTNTFYPVKNKYDSINQLISRIDQNK